MKKSSNKGFTLVELIIVIAILAIIMLIAIPNFSGIQQRMQVRADKSTAAQIGKAVRVWFTDYTTDKGMISAKKSTDDHALGYTYAPYAVELKDADGDVTHTYVALPQIETDKDEDDVITTTVAPVRYDELVTISEYITRDQEPTSLKPSNVTAANQHYCVFLTAGATDTAAKIGVAITTAATDLAAGNAVGDTVTITLEDGKVVDNYDGTAPGVAYVEP